MKNMSKTTTNSSAAWNLYQARMGPNSNTKTPETHNLDAQTSPNCFEKKRRCYTMVNMPPSNYFQTCRRHQIWNEIILCIKFLSLNICYAIYVLLWIKYWLMWFEILLVFILLKFKKRPNTSGIRVVQRCIYIYIYRCIYIYIYIYILLFCCYYYYYYYICLFVHLLLIIY